MSLPHSISALAAKGAKEHRCSYDKSKNHTGRHRRREKLNLDLPQFRGSPGCAAQQMLVEPSYGVRHD